LTIYGETCPHYLTLTNSDMLARGYSLKVSPPLRSSEDREAMWRGVAQGSFYTIGSDFTGYTRTLKLTGRIEGEAVEPERGAENIFEIANGLSTLEFMMPVVWSYGVNRGRITIPRFVELFCENPAKIFGIYPRKGSLQPGADADLVIWDQTKPHLVEKEHGKSDLVTFHGMQLLGMPVMTMVRGMIVMDNGSLIGRPGAGKFVPRNPNRAAYAPGGPAVR
jgi:dihydropyrimidinase